MPDSLLGATSSSRAFWPLGFPAVRPLGLSPGRGTELGEHGAAQGRPDHSHIDSGSKDGVEKQDTVLVRCFYKTRTKMIPLF